jgi:hypothetical protein
LRSQLDSGEVLGQCERRLAAEIAIAVVTEVKADPLHDLYEPVRVAAVTRGGENGSKASACGSRRSMSVRIMSPVHTAVS